MTRVMRHCVSKLFQPRNIVPIGVEVKHDEILSKSQKLMSDLGVIRPANNGFFHILPLGERVLSKLISIICEEMHKIDAQKVILPSLVDANLWRTSGRLDDDVAVEELFTLRDRHDKMFVLSPTHEEAITDFVSSLNCYSHRHFPIRLYQITSKFRDERRPRFGLLRSKEFLMKDLYTFDTDLEKAKFTYNAVTATYENILKKIGVKYVRVKGLTGVIGGSVSHEFHFPCEVGEDRLLVCNACGEGNNAEALPHPENTTHEGKFLKCSTCGKNSVSPVQGIEVGHTFLLGTRYTMPFKAQFKQSDGKPGYLQMGCFGLGITRILAAVVECLSEPSEIRWPLILSPFKVCIIPPKAGSKESSSVSELFNILCHQLSEMSFLCDDVIVDDRLNLSIGRRLRDTAQVGYPLAVILGKQAAQPQPLLEIHNFLSGQQVLLPLSDAIQYIVQHTNLSCDPLMSDNSQTENMSISNC